MGREIKLKEWSPSGPLLLLDCAPAAAVQKTVLVDMVTELELLKKICGCLPRKADAHAHKEVTC